ncbi:ABC transporter ATP-binding protein [Nitrosomonas sp.]|uniref:ABC transporter ATP-binding protein n=1 Tax=Nitrosomonas sp. TaxID=42353 RepID=UPI0025EA3E9D|nr:ABC transporter ATP-binding protein [Nitrosomonas sp.]
MAEQFLKIRNANKSFTKEGNSLPVLNDISLDMYTGEFLAILGPSGCGKSTLLNILAGQNSLDDGSISYPDKPTKNLNDRNRIAVVWQEESLIPWKTAYGNIEFSLIATQIPDKCREEVSIKWLHAVGLKGFEDYYPSQLSQGMRKRVALAAALSTHPHLLLMDEPFGALDVYSKLQIEKEVVRLWEQLDTTIILVTHDVQEAIALSDRIVILTQRPAKIKSIRENPLPRPRNLDALYGNIDFHNLVRELWVELTQQD